jgi:hypothetical protein
MVNLFRSLDFMKLTVLNVLSSCTLPRTITVANSGHSDILAEGMLQVIVSANAMPSLATGFKVMGFFIIL